MSHRLATFLLFLFVLVIDIQSLPAQDNPQFIIEQITISGNSKTRPGVIYELLPYAVSDTVSESAIHTGIDDLRATNMFKHVELQPRAGSQPGYLLLNIQVDERHWPTLQFKGGFSELTGWYITPLSINMDNLLGFGNRASLDLTFGYHVVDFNINFISPNTFDSDLDLLLRARVRSQEFFYYENREKYSHPVGQAGYFLGLRPRSGLFRNVFFGWDLYTNIVDSTVTHVESDAKSTNLPPAIAAYTDSAHVTSAFSVHLNLDKRDLAYYPRKGWWLGVWYSHATKRVGGTDAFDRVIIDARAYQSLGKQIVLAGRIKAGAISPDAPFYEKMYLGGPNSLRGYEDRSIGPIGGGDKLLHGGLELRAPITPRHYPNHFITAVLFVDGGTNLLTNEYLNEDNIFGSYGFGFRFRLPFIRMLRMDFAYPMNGDPGMVQFSIGQTF
ncbi:BamA/TamA family outer membrane protein [candidate division KSB1 bacterium]|nr:BamA/TamA family outer membrane protein [candidate division KSB1 bacterium]